MTSTRASGHTGSCSGTPTAQNKWHHLYQLLLHVDHLPLKSSKFIAFTSYLVVEIAHTGFLFPSDPSQSCLPIFNLAIQPLYRPGYFFNVSDFKHTSSLLKDCFASTLATVLVRRPMRVGAGNDDPCRRNRLHGLVPPVRNRHSRLTGRRCTLRGEIGILLRQGLDLGRKCESGSCHIGGSNGLG